MAIASYLPEYLGSIYVEKGKTYTKDNISADADLFWVSEGKLLLKNKRGLRCTITSAKIVAITPLPNVPTLMEEGVSNATVFGATSSYTFLNDGIISYGKMVIVS